MDQKKDQSKSPKQQVQVREMVRLAEYQKDSIVSQTVIEETTGTVTFFAFDQGQGLSEHTVPYDALVYLLDGEAQITISGKPHRLTAGQMVIMPAHEPHALKATRRFKMILTMVRA